MRLRKTKILVVDDEKDICDVVRSFLEKRGYAVLTASDKEEALRLFRMEAPAVMLLDIRLQDASGLDILKEVKEQDPQTRVLMLTGLKDEENIRRAKELGADDYIAKPFTMEFLEKVVLQKISLMALKSAEDKRE